MSDFKKMYVEATDTLNNAIQARIEATKGILVEFLAEKGLDADQSCLIRYGSGEDEKAVKGVFKIIVTDKSADLKFMPYKKDGTLSKNPRIFCFGKLPELVWKNGANLINSVLPYNDTSVIAGDEQEED